jgi:Family of unknown function (DUF6444)
MHTACGPGAIVGCTQRASVPIRQGEVHPSSGCHGALSRLSSEPILHTDWPFPFSPVDWTQAPPAGQASLAAFHQEIEQRKQRIAVLEARPQAPSEPSCRPPSSDAPCRIGRTQRDRMTAGRPGAQLGHPGVHQTWLSPTSTAHLRPTACRGGHRALAGTVPYSTHQSSHCRPSTWTSPMGSCIRRTARAGANASRRHGHPSTQPDTAPGPAPCLAQWLVCRARAAY